jgi:hypothetical protein
VPSAAGGVSSDLWEILGRFDQALSLVVVAHRSLAAKESADVGDEEEGDLCQIAGGVPGPGARLTDLCLHRVSRDTQSTLTSLGRSDRDGSSRGRAQPLGGLSENTFGLTAGALGYHRVCDAELGCRQPSKLGALVRGYRVRPVSATFTANSKHDATPSYSGNGWSSCDWNSCR